jgi:hypothetical protein
VPARSSISDRALVICRQKNPELVTQVFIDLAIALAPRVNRKEISRRSAASKLSGRLMDFDKIVNVFIPDGAEKFYQSIKTSWDWNSRYWEQCALLKLDHYLADKSNSSLLEEAIQNARFAYSIESHPLSLTTLAKMLFNAMDEDSNKNKEAFDEAWGLISQSIEIEANWTNISATAFVVCFSGVIRYVNFGGLLNGDQIERLRDIIAISYRRNLHGNNFRKIRDAVSDAVF